jgi:hypothetical protein
MGYLSRICYAWVSPKLTVAVIRLLHGNPDFSPCFDVAGGVEGLGTCFRILLMASVALLLVARKNLITWLCVIVFVSSNFAPLRYIGYNRYFPQIWMLFPLAAMNFVYTTKDKFVSPRMKCLRAGVAVLLAIALGGVAGLSSLRTLAYQGRMLVQESFRQNLIASFSGKKEVKVAKQDYWFTTIQRFRQAGLRLVKADGAEVDTVMQKHVALPCYDSRPEFYMDLNTRFLVCGDVGDLLFKFHWLDVFDNLPHVLWDDNAKGVAK